MREVRADRDGIRTFIEIDSVRIKFGMVLANTDRGQDESVHARDLIDLAFLAAAHGKRAMQPGFAIATEAYGNAVASQLADSLGSLASSRMTTERHLKALGIIDTVTLRKGLRVLGSMAKG